MLLNTGVDTSTFHCPKHSHDSKVWQLKKLFKKIVQLSNRTPGL